MRIFMPQSVIFKQSLYTFMTYNYVLMYYLIDSQDGITKLLIFELICPKKMLPDISGSKEIMIELPF